MIGADTMDGVEMPSHNIRHSIATKVAAKKTAKGYTLSDENCVTCEMSLMVMNGKKECKVCPAIKKWVQRKNEAECKEAVEARDADEVVEEEEAEDRDEAPIFDHPVDDDERSEADYVDRDEKPEFGLATTSTMDSESLSEHLMQFKMSTSEDSNDRYGLSKSGSDESEDTEAIRARARQIIMAARGKGEWNAGISDSEDSDDDSNIDSPQLSWDDNVMEYSKEAIEEGCIQERAGEIINQARKNLLAEHGMDDFPPEEIVSPHIETSSSSGINEVTPGMGSWEAAIKIQSVVRRSLAKDQYLNLMREEIRKYQDDEENAASEAASFQEYRSEDWADNADETQDVLQDNDEQGAGQDGNQYSVEDVTQDYEEDAQYIVEDVTQEYDEGAEYAVENVSQDCEDGAEYDVVEDVSQDYEEPVYKLPVAEEETTEPVDDEVVEDVADEIAQDAVQEDVAHDTLNEVADFANTHDGAGPSPPESVEEASENIDPRQAPQMAPQMIAEQLAQPAPPIAPQQVNMGNYSAVLQKQNEVTARDVANRAPSRNFFAQLACKFDDAVTDAIGKVHSVVTCSIGEPNACAGQDFGDAFDAEQSQLDPANNGEFVVGPSSGQVDHHMQVSLAQARYEAQIMALTANGWRIADASCNDCNRTAMIRPEDGQMVCAACDNVTHLATNPAVMGALTGPPRPEILANQVQARRQQPVANHPPPCPASVANQLYIIEMNRRVQMAKLAASSTPLNGMNNTHQSFNNAQYAAAMASLTPVNGMSQIHQNFNTTPSANPLRDVTAAHYGMAAGPAKPPMAPPMHMPKPTNQAHQPAPKASSGAPPLPPTESNDPREASALTPKQHQVIAPTPNQLSQIAHLQNQIQMMQVAPLGSLAQYDDTKENSSQSANVSKQLQAAKLQIDDAKKFILSRNNRRLTPSSGVPPLNKMTPSSGMHHMANMNGMTTLSGMPMMAMSPGAQVFRPNVGVMTPSQGFTGKPAINNNMAPETQTSVFRPQMSMMTTPGAQIRAPTPEMRAMGSLMSPGSGTNQDAHQDQASYEEATSQVDAPGVAASGTEDDGYRTPQMPGKYFFA